VGVGDNRRVCCVGSLRSRILGGIGRGRRLEGGCVRLGVEVLEDGRNLEGGETYGYLYRSSASLRITQSCCRSSEMISFLANCSPRSKRDGGVQMGCCPSFSVCSIILDVLVTFGSTSPQLPQFDRCLSPR